MALGLLVADGFQNNHRSNPENTRMLMRVESFIGLFNGIGSSNTFIGFDTVEKVDCFLQKYSHLLKSTRHLNIGFKLGFTVTVIPTGFFPHFSGLQVLTISNTCLMSLQPFQFTTLPLLEKLDLSNNQISRVHRTAFYGNSKLTDLDLSGNFTITGKIPEKTFSKAEKLRRLKLRNCPKLDSIPEELADANITKSLTVLDISRSGVYYKMNRSLSVALKRREMNSIRSKDSSFTVISKMLLVGEVVFSVISARDELNVKHKIQEEQKKSSSTSNAT